MFTSARRRAWTYAASVGAASLLLGLSGASCNSMPLTAPSGTSITLIASTVTLPVNGTTDVTAVLIEGGVTGSGTDQTVTPGVGTPVANGTLVSFTTTLGRLEPSEARTDGGKAVVKLHGDGRSGKATITAISGPASKTLDVAIGAAGATRIAVTANPQTVSAGGGSTTIIASVQDAQGNGLLGVPVSFTTTAGTLSATTVVTNEGGNASTTLTTNAAATVTASSGGASEALTGSVDVTMKSKISLTLSAPTSLTVSVPASFTVGVTATGGGTPVVKNVVVDFGDGSTPAQLGEISGNTPVQHLFSGSGALTMKITATDPDGQTTSINSPIVVAPLSAVGVANPASVALGGSILFTVTPTTGALIDHYVWDFGEGDPPISSVSNAQSHVYLSKGGHTATVTVFPQAGPAFTLTVPIVIN